MTDNEIVKGLECCRNNAREDECKYCLSCPMAHCELDEDEELNCMDAVLKRAIDLINQQKAEIEMLECSIISQDEEKLSYVAMLIKEEQERIRLEQIRRLEAENSELQRKNAELQYENVELQYEKVNLKKRSNKGVCR